MKPILFKTEMVEAILAGRKTVTRRVMKPQPREHVTRLYPIDGKQWKGYFGSREDDALYKPPFQPGDVLYVREACVWDDPEEKIGTGCFLYRAGGDVQENVKWTPGIHMPKEAARIFLRVKDVWAEPLQRMGVWNAMQEGIEIPTEELQRMNLLNQLDAPSIMEKFQKLWDSTIQKEAREKYRWEANPWVWVIEFTRIKRPEV